MLAALCWSVQSFISYLACLQLDFLSVQSQLLFSFFLLLNRNVH